MLLLGIQDVPSASLLIPISPTTNKSQDNNKEGEISNILHILQCVNTNDIKKNVSDPMELGVQNSVTTFHTLAQEENKAGSSDVNGAGTKDGTKDGTYHEVVSALMETKKMEGEDVREQGREKEEILPMATSAIENLVPISASRVDREQPNSTDNAQTVACTIHQLSATMFESKSSSEALASSFESGQLLLPPTLRLVGVTSSTTDTATKSGCVNDEVSSLTIVSVVNNDGCFPVIITPFAATVTAAAATVDVVDKMECEENVQENGSNTNKQIFGSTGSFADLTETCESISSENTVAASKITLHPAATDFTRDGKTESTDIRPKCEREAETETGEERHEKKDEGDGGECSRACLFYLYGVSAYCTCGAQDRFIHECLTCSLVMSSIHHVGVATTKLLDSDIQNSSFPMLFRGVDHLVGKFHFLGCRYFSSTEQNSMLQFTRAILKRHPQSLGENYWCYLLPLPRQIADCTVHSFNPYKYLEKDRRQTNLDTLLTTFGLRHENHSETLSNEIRSEAIDNKFTHSEQYNLTGSLLTMSNDDIPNPSRFDWKFHLMSAANEVEEFVKNWVEYVDDSEFGVSKKTIGDSSVATFSTVTDDLKSNSSSGEVEKNVKSTNSFFRTFRKYHQVY